ncbi:hypothetical protein [Actinacidiphila alni]|uniref:hypothetical protein n=1 Tax=Actinacidiphila alni TaxID=380248 RepID=UPI0034557BEE
MSTGAVVAIIVVAVIVVALIAFLAVRGGGAGGMSGARLKHRFGPEYDRVLDGHDGDVKATRAELSERVKRYGGLEPRPLSERDRERYGAEWNALQAKFVDEPATAVGQADALIGRIAAERGFPGADSPEHFDALSVHHPHTLGGYRQAHTLAGGPGASGVAGGASGHGGPQKRQSTEELRKALVNARGLFEDLTRDDGRPTRATTADDEAAATEPYEPDADESADTDATHTKTAGHRAPLSERFAALTGGRRDRTDDERL